MKKPIRETLLAMGLPLLLLGGCANEHTTTGFWQELQDEVAINEGQQRSGEQVYQFRCQGCHGKNTQGAPMPGDRYEWERRSAQGLEVLMAHTVDGYRQKMPPRGGCRNCSELELRRALTYMLQQSEIQLPENVVQP